MKAHIESHGCALNRGEALQFESRLEAGGWQIVGRPEDADVNVIATCVVIGTTENEMTKRIKKLRSLGKPMIVTGCMASTLKKKIESIAPDARIVHPAEIEELCEAVGMNMLTKYTPKSWPNTHCHTIPIATGCLGDCSYCITRTARGELRSRAIGDILEEISGVDISRGAKEIQLTAQDAAAYGKDIESSLPGLMTAIAELDMNIKIRIGMMTPRFVLTQLDELVKAYSHEKIFKFLHLPIQSANESLLGDMGRGYTVEDYENIVTAFRRAYPEMTLSTDIIVGYPGETDSHHISNMRFLRRIRPDIVNITRFSPRPGTRAAYLENKITGWKTKNRSRELTKLRFEISLDKNRAKIGRRMKAIVTERGLEGTMIARSDNYEQIVVHGDPQLGSTVDVRIVDCSPIHLLGEIRQQ